VTGFTVLINGIPFKQILSPTDRSTEIRVPGFCGTKLEITMVANLDQKQSLPSNMFADQQPDCTLYAVVRFKQVRFGWTNDSLNPNNKCDTLQSYFNLSVTEIFDRYQDNERSGRKKVKSFWGGGFYMPVRCGHYQLDDLAGSYYAQDALHPTQITVPLRPLDGHSADYLIEAAMWDYDNWPNNDDLIARFNGSISIRPNQIEGLLKKMQGSPKMIKDYYCDSYVGYFSGDAYSGIYVCVDIYSDNPSTGTSTVPSNAPLSEPAAKDPSPSPGLQFISRSDLAILESFIDSNDSYNIRVRNEGPDDLVDVTLKITTTIQTDDPNLGGSPWTRDITHFDLKNNARIDLYTYPWGKLDTAKYNYTFSIEMTTEGFTDPDPTNNKHSTSFAASALQSVQDPLTADLKIVDIRSNGYDDLIVVVQNGGPDVISFSKSTVTCEATEVSRKEGTARKIEGLERAINLKLDPDDREQITPIPTKPDSDLNLLLNWYIVSCQVKADGSFADLNPANNFFTKTVQ